MMIILSPEVIDLIDDDNSIWEEGPVEALSSREEMAAYVHDGFWHPMDTLRDKRHLEKLWALGNAPWKTWI